MAATVSCLRLSRSSLLYPPSSSDGVCVVAGQAVPSLRLDSVDVVEELLCSLDQLSRVRHDHIIAVYGIVLSEDDSRYTTAYQRPHG